MWFYSKVLDEEDVLLLSMLAEHIKNRKMVKVYFSDSFSSSALAFGDQKQAFCVTNRKNCSF